MANCADNVYVIKYTDRSKGTVTITKSSLVTNLLDIALVGKSRLGYGEIFNENLLHILENFACPESTGTPGTPDAAIAFGTLLDNPVQGQKWFNSTNARLYIYTSDTWVPQGKTGDVAGNSGITAHDTFIPRPVSPDGYVFPYNECSFTVSPFSYKSISVDGATPRLSEVDYMQCYAQADGRVVMKFRHRGESSIRNGYVNYQIIGIRGEIYDTDDVYIEIPIPEPTPGVSVSVPASPTPTPTRAASPTPTPGASPAATVGASPTPTLTPTPTITVSPTQAASPTPTPSASPTPSVTPSASRPAAVINTSGYGSVIAQHPEGVLAQVSFTFNADGTFTKSSSETGTTTGTWLSNANGTASTYEVFATRTSNVGGGDFTGTYGSWLNLGTARSFGDTSQAIPLTPYTTETDVDFQIRRVSDQVIVANTSIFFYAVSGAPV